MSKTGNVSLKINASSFHFCAVSAGRASFTEKCDTHGKCPEMWIWHNFDTVGKPLNRASLEHSLCIKTGLNVVGQRGFPTVSTLVNDEFIEVETIFI